MCSRTILLASVAVVAAAVLAGFGFGLAAPAPYASLAHSSASAMPVDIELVLAGDDDFWARAIAKHMANHMPGNPVIVGRISRSTPAFAGWENV